jgi:hypothetical protein
MLLLVLFVFVFAFVSMYLSGERGERGEREKGGGIFQIKRIKNQ